MSTRAITRRRGFTLLEVMIVVSIVFILSWLAMVVIGRIRERAARTVILNTLRQLYDAKEYYFSETGASTPVSVRMLVHDGYVSQGVSDRIFAHTSLGVSSGWRYFQASLPGQPTFAYRGTVPGNPGPAGEVIYYPGPPSSIDALFGRQPPAASSTGGGANPPGSSGTGGPAGGNPPGGGTTTGGTTTAGGTAGGNTGAGGSGAQGSAGGNSSPGNSAFGHAQGNSGNSHGNSQGKGKGHD